jgi:hypothetical protein
MTQAIHQVKIDARNDLTKILACVENAKLVIELAQQQGWSEEELTDVIRLLHSLQLTTSARIF